MKTSKLFLFLFVFSFSLVRADTEIGSVRKKIASGKASVSDYFLACDPCYIGIPEDSWNDKSRFRRNLLLSNDKKALYYTASSSGSSKYENFVVVNNRIMDAKNGYVKVTGVDNELGVEYTAAIFTTKTKKYFVWVFYGEGGDGDTYQFQLFEPSANNWQDVTRDLLPKFDFTDFSKNKTVFEYAKMIQWEFVVPRYGTTAYLRPHPEYEVGEDEQKYKKYKEYIGTSHAMELKWDKVNGIFIKGKILDQKEYENAKK